MLLDWEEERGQNGACSGNCQLTPCQMKGNFCCWSSMQTFGSFLILCPTGSCKTIVIRTAIAILFMETSRDSVWKNCGSKQFKMHVPQFSAFQSLEVLKQNSELQEAPDLIWAQFQSFSIHFGSVFTWTNAPISLCIWIHSEPKVQV